MRALVVQSSRAVRRQLRWTATTGSGGGTTKEVELRDRLESALDATYVQVQDTSSGCGEFFSIYVVSPKFGGLKLVEQHRLVQQVLKADISNMHGVTLVTKPPPAAKPDQHE